MKRLFYAIALMASSIALGAPQPYPVTINSRVQTAPPLLVYRANESLFRVSFTDGSTASDITNTVPFFNWSTNASTSVNSTSSYSVVSWSTGVVDFTFSPTAVNHSAGRYFYEIGVLANGQPRTYRQGVFTIADSPVGAGVASVTWTTNVNWGLVTWSGTPTVTINGVSGNIKTNIAFTVSASTNGLVASDDYRLTDARPPTAHNQAWSTITNTPTLFTVADVRRVYDPENTNRWASLGTSNNIVICEAVVSGTNFTVTLSADFEETITHTRPAWTNHVWPFVDGLWEGKIQSDTLYVILYNEATAAWANNDLLLPASLPAFTGTSQGTATVSIASYSYVTNSLSYNIYTNRVPDWIWTMGNLDVLQGYLNGIYATQSNLATKVNVTGGVATNITIVGGSAAFTGSATGNDAVSSNGFVTLHQLQESAAIYKTWQFWSGSNSTVLSGAKAMRTIDEGNAPYGVWTNSFSANTNGAYITYCSLPAGLTSLKAGLYTVNANIWQSGVAQDAVSLGAEIYTRATNGVETELTVVSGTPAQTISAESLEYVFSLNIPSNAPMAVTDSVLVKFKTSGMAGAPITVYINGGFLSVPVPSTQYALKSETGWLSGMYLGLTNGTYRIVGTNVYWILTP